MLLLPDVLHSYMPYVYRKCKPQVFAPFFGWCKVCRNPTSGTATYLIIQVWASCYWISSTTIPNIATNHVISIVDELFCQICVELCLTAFGLSCCAPCQPVVNNADAQYR